MATEEDRRLAREIARAAVPLTGARRDFDPLLDRIGDARVVLVGEASHGSHEFYRLRAELTKRLIVEKRFTAIAAEADWPDALRTDAYVRGHGTDRDAVDALGDFRRFPAWMWRNADVLDFVGWLRTHNQNRAPRERVGFYGLDLYSLHSSVAAVLRFLDRVDPAAARRARQRYECFEQFGGDPQTYGAHTALGLTANCEAEVVAQLVELQGLRRGSRASSDDEPFFAEQNARVVRNAEAYYRAMFRSHVGSWNLRDTHMADTLDAPERRGHRDHRPPLLRRTARPRGGMHEHRDPRRHRDRRQLQAAVVAERMPGAREVEDLAPLRLRVVVQPQRAQRQTRGRAPRVRRRR